MQYVNSAYSLAVVAFQVYGTVFCFFNLLLQIGNISTDVKVISVIKAYWKLAFISRAGAQTHTILCLLFTDILAPQVTQGVHASENPNKLLLDEFHLKKQQFLWKRGLFES